MDEVPSNPATAGVEERDTKGRFQPGNTLGKGNIGSRRMAEMRRAWHEATTPLKMQAVEQAIYQAVIDGDMMAARLWLDYTLGKPKALPDEADEDAQPLVIEPPEPVRVTA